MPPEGREPVLSIVGAERSFGSRRALKAVSLEVRPGEALAVVGRNGAGKSTLLKAAVGALRLDAGTVRVLGEDPSSLRVRRHIGLAPQEIALWGHLTVRENLAAAAALGGVPVAQRARAVEGAMVRTRCLERAGDRVERLSGGWRRRANLAAAIVHGPALLVLDEPGEGLDAELRAHLALLVSALKREGAAILIVSHDIDEVIALADRALVIEAGEALAEGPPAELLERAFGGRRELVVIPSTACGPAERAALEALGLAWDGARFTALSRSPFELARQAEAALLDQGVRQVEAEVRTPGLDAVIAWAAGAR